MRTPIARLRARVTLERPAASPGEIGGGARGWEFAGAAWARVEPLVGKWRVEIRMRRDVAPGWRLALADRFLRVCAIVDADDIGAFLYLDCEEDIP